MATYVYVDGLNFYYGAVRHTGSKWVDFEALARVLVPKDVIGRVRYFTARVKPRYPGDKTQERQNALIRAIRANPLIEVHEGHFRSEVRWRALADRRHSVRELFRPTLRPVWVGGLMFADVRRRRTEPFTVARVVIDEEKGSDVNLGAHLVHDALTGACGKAIVITNDSDLAEPIKLARGAGTQVGLVNPHPEPTNKRLLNVATFEIPFRAAVVAKCQLPNTVKDAKGREVHRPREWR